MPELVERFYRRIGMPYLTDVEIDWGGLAVMDALPARLPDLSAFEPLVVHARYGYTDKTSSFNRTKRRTASTSKAPEVSWRRARQGRPKSSWRRRVARVDVPVVGRRRRGQRPTRSR